MNIPLSKVVWGIVIAIAAYLIYFYAWSGETDIVATWKNYVFRSSDDGPSQKAIEPEPDPTDGWVK